MTQTLKKNWNGYEDKRELVRKLACEYRDADAALEQECKASGFDPIAVTINAYKGNDSNLHEADVAGKALRELTRIHAELVQTHNFDFDFVRAEWASILDPLHWR